MTDTSFVWWGLNTPTENCKSCRHSVIAEHCFRVCMKFTLVIWYVGWMVTIDSLSRSTQYFTWAAAVSSDDNVGESMQYRPQCGNNFCK